MGAHFTISAHMGMLLNRPGFGDGERLDRVRDLVTRVIQSLYDKP
ncbi:hypothetical protein [Sphingomonas sp.]